MDNLRFETSKLKIPFYCIKNEIIDDYCIFVNLTQLFYQFSILSTREPPPQHFLAFYSHIFIEDFISKYHFHLLYSLVFLTIKDRMIETKSQIRFYHFFQHSLYHPSLYSKLRRQVLLSFILACFLVSFSQYFFQIQYFLFSNPSQPFYSLFQEKDRENDRNKSQICSCVFFVRARWSRLLLLAPVRE